MKYKVVFIGFFAAVSILVFACKKDVTTAFEGDYGYNFFPVDSGSFVIYQIDSVIYDDFNSTVRNSTIFLKEQIGEQFIDNLGRTAKRVIRSYSNVDSTIQKWETSNVYYIIRNKLVAERVEENLRYVKMVFPNENNINWLGNKYIISAPPYIIDTSNYLVRDWKYTISRRDREYLINASRFDSTLIITQIQDSSAIYKTFAKEVYARNIGMIYKENWIVTSQDTIKIRLQYPWQDRADRGFIIRQYAIDYGKE
jgi:hypothetical protein